ncbi:MAG: hypothetical protein AABY22_35685 [Nanoarchaeota archaeon]
MKGLAALTLSSQIPQSFSASPQKRTPDLSVLTYEVEQVGAEYRFKRGGIHFGTLITQNQQGSIWDFRPHPDGGQDDNAWGTSFYMQPFLPGAVLRNTVIRPTLINSNGINIEAQGKISRGNSETFGDWSSSIVFSYISEERVEASGNYFISLDNSLASVGQDLNLFKIASNYLVNVPLVPGGFGDTGDMQRADIYFNNDLKFSWIPKTGSTYPTDNTNNMAIDVIGQYNQVLQKGVSPAYKPNLWVKIQRLNPFSDLSRMISGSFYDESRSQDFSADNVGITPLILKDAPETFFFFNIWLKSTPYRPDTAAQHSEIYR